MQVDDRIAHAALVLEQVAILLPGLRPQHAFDGRLQVFELHDGHIVAAFRGLDLDTRDHARKIVRVRVVEQVLVVDFGKRGMRVGLQELGVWGERVVGDVDADDLLLELELLQAVPLDAVCRRDLVLHVGVVCPVFDLGEQIEQ